MIKGIHIGKELLHIRAVHRLLPAHGFGYIFNHLAGGVPQGGGAVEHRCDKGVVHMFQKQLGRLDLHVIIEIVIFPGSGQIVLIFGAFLGF